MKRNLSIFGLAIIGVLICCNIYFNKYYEHVPECWPSMDKMEKNLSKKDYEIHKTNEIIIGNHKYSGNRLYAKKNKNFIDVYWCSNDEPLQIIQDYCSNTYESDYILQVGLNIYCGSRKAMKDAGIKLR